MIYTSMAQLKETNESRRKVDQGHPLLVAAREALEDEPADRQAQFIKVLITPTFCSGGVCVLSPSYDGCQ